MEALFAFFEKYLPLTDAEREIIRRSNVQRSYAKHEVIHTGDNGYFVLSGGVGAYQMHQDKQVLSEFYFEGEAVLSPGLDLLCLEPTTLAVSSGAETARQMAQFPRFESVCRRVAEERLAESLALADQLRLLSPLERYQLVTKKRPQLLQRVPQHLLASYLGVAPETLSRLRKQLVTTRRS